MPYEFDQANLLLLKKQYSEATRRTIFFIGAGCSAEVGIPTWNGLANGLFDYIDTNTPTSALKGDLLDAFHETEQAYKDGEYWRFFDLAESKWSQLYEDYLEQRFSHDFLCSCPVPKVYTAIWRMRNVGQVLTLNIDGLLGRAYQEAFPSQQDSLMEFPGTSVTDSRSFFERNHPLLLNLHGSYAMRSSWVMKGTERDRLFSGFENGNYRSFIKSIFEKHNVVFLGVNVRDGAVSPIIEQISTEKLFQNHFWITSDVSTEDYTWAQQNGVRVINYTPDRDDKGSRVDSKSILSILDDIEKYRSFDEDAVLPELPRSDDELPSPKELLKACGVDRLDVRKKLSERLEALGRSNGFDSKRINAFIREYALAIEHSSMLGLMPEYDRIEDIHVTSEISTSNSSSVWLGVRQDQSLICLKSLSAQAFKDRVERESFRRGVESLYYHNTCNRPVAPKYLLHTNEPMSVGMEHVEGTTVNDLFDSDRNAVRENWLELALSIFGAVLVCHKSEGGVLHRDLKPKNMILEGVYYGAESAEIASSSVRFINFDMSWHKFSSGNTKSVAADEVGYYAPEQRVSANAGTPRSAKTDVYMLGMFLVYLMSEAPPPEGGAKLDGWEDYVGVKVRGRLKDPLASNRLSRLIVKMTAVDPEDRPDLTEAIADLEVLKPVLSENWNAVDPDVFVEKILTSVDYDYIWDDLLLEGMLKTPRQIELKVGFKQRGQLATISFMRARDDGMNRRNFGGRLGELIAEVKNELGNSGWATDAAGGYHSRSINATIPISALRGDPAKGISQTKNTLEKLMKQIT